MNGRLFLLTALLVMLAPEDRAAAELTAAPQRVYVLPIRDDIMPPLVYLVRRGVKAAMEANADAIVLDMDTNGGRVDSTEEIIEILAKFKGQTITYVNNKAYSAGAFISVATQKIYMAPESVIGAAAPIMLGPGGMGVQEMPNIIRVKMTSALSAKIRAYAQKHGHNAEVIEAMIDEQKELKLDGQVLNEKGKILTLTNREAEKEYGQPPRSLLSLGTIETLEGLLRTLGYDRAQMVYIQPSGAERVGSWINALNWLWLIVGVVGLYIEFKTPGFGVPGIAGICGFALFFLGSYVAGLTGWEIPLLFVTGFILVLLELLVFPGTVALGVVGATLMLATVVLAMVDMYPGPPTLPTLPQLEVPFRDLSFAALGSVAVIFVLSRILPRTALYGALVTQSASGVVSVEAEEEEQSAQLGQEGVSLSNLRPGGKAQFGERILDVITQGDLIPKGRRVRIIGHSGREAIVEPVGN